MGLRVFDFECPNGHVFESFEDAETREIACRLCAVVEDASERGAVAVRQIATPRFALDGCSGDFPTAADAWEKRRVSHMKKEQKNMENHDTYR